MYTETFVLSHVEGLPFDISILAGRDLASDGDGVRIDSPGLAARVLRLLRRKALKSDWHTFVQEAITRFLTKAKIDVVLAEFGHAGVKMLPSCLNAAVPLVVHFHGADAYGANYLGSFEQAYREMFQKAAACVAVSRDMRGQLLQLGAPPERVVYVPYGINVDQFSRAAPADAPPHFVAVGRFVEKKAPHVTLVAFAKLLSDVPEARLVMIGDGDLFGPVQQLAQAMGIASAVEFCGILNHAAVAQKMRSVRAFVQHSIRASNGDAEGTPLAVLEAQASGLPVVATRHMGISDVVVEGETGFLVDELDTNAMAARMRHLAQHPGDAQRLGAAGRQRIKSDFRADAQLSKLEAILRAAAMRQRIPTFGESTS